jgi:hypothetical protein
MKKLTYLLLLTPMFFFTSCSAQIWKQAEDILKEQTNSKPTQEEAGNGIKEALINGITKGVANVSVLDGYFGNPKIKLPFPEDAKKVETKLRDLGMDKEADNVILTINRAAEDAASEAKAIFITAIKSLTFEDAFKIVKGSDDEATQFLMRTTTDQLAKKFKPIIQVSLDKVDATKYWADVMGIYNKIPFVEKVETDLAEYVTRKAIAGLFVMIAKEELAIRQDPAARTSDLLKKVFSGNW